MSYNPISGIPLTRSVAHTTRLAALAFVFLCSAANSPLPTDEQNRPQEKSAGAPPAWPRILQEQVVRLAGTEYRLRVAAGPVCKQQFAETGLVIDFILSYNSSTQNVVRAAIGMGDLPMVIGVVNGSPAALSDVRAGDTILEINGTAMSRIIQDSPDAGLLPEQLRNSIAQTPDGQVVNLVLDRQGERITTSITPVRLCGTHFLLKPGSGSIAWSDGYTVAIGGKLMNSVNTEDELALVAGHELAHVIYGDEDARSLAERRKMEDRADLLGADLARCAGYDVTTGLAFWRRFNAKDWLRWMRDPTHRNVPERIRRMTAHMALPPQCPPDPVAVDASVLP